MGSGGRNQTNGEDELGRRGGPSGAGIDRWVIIYDRWWGGGVQRGLSWQNQIRFRLIGVGWGGFKVTHASQVVSALHIWRFRTSVLILFGSVQHTYVC